MEARVSLRLFAIFFELMSFVIELMSEERILKHCGNTEDAAVKTDVEKGVMWTADIVKGLLRN